MRKEEIALELYDSAKENGFLDTIYEVIGPKVSVSIAFTKKACETNIDDIEFSVRANNALKRAGYFVINDVVDALAVAIGSAHGVYKKKPMLNIERLKEIRAEIDTPLVLHGGSGLSDDDFRNAIREGIAKVNIFTDLCLAGDRAVADGIKKGLGYLETRNLKVQYIKEEVMKKIRLFGSENKA